MASVFLSHSSKDKAFARKLASELQANGVTVWIDEAEIRIGDSLTKKISLAIDEADLSPGTSKPATEGQIKTSQLPPCLVAARRARNADLPRRSYP